VQEKGRLTMKNILIIIAAVSLLSCVTDDRSYYEIFLRKVEGYITTCERIPKVTFDNSGNSEDSLKKIIDCNFDYTGFLKVFDQLSMDKDRVLHIYYMYTRPYVIVSEKTTDYDSLISALEKNEVLFEYAHTTNPVFKFIHLSGTTESYFQYAIFGLRYDYFCLFDHSCYMINNIIVSKKGLDRILELKSDFYDFSNEEKMKIRSVVRPEPGIIEYADSVSVRVVRYSPWRGFSELVFSMNKTYPHDLRLSNSKILYAKDCGIMF